MKYFLDTEFVEGTQVRTFLGFKIGDTKPTIDLISIGIVAEDGREYYAVSKDFNLKEAWNRYQIEYRLVDLGRDKKEIKVYWLRENVLYKIFYDFYIQRNGNSEFGNLNNFVHHMERSGKAFELFKQILNEYGKTNKQIADQIEAFVYDLPVLNKQRSGFIAGKSWNSMIPIEFYADYCSYDWVVFCWLFGKMINLPKGFPMYCNDLQQLFASKIKVQKDTFLANGNSITFDLVKKGLKNRPDYPKQDASKKHHALEDARYDKDLYNFLSKL